MDRKSGVLYAGFDALGAASNGVAVDIARGRGSRLGLVRTQRGLIDELAKGNVSAKPSKWSEMMVGTHRYRLNAPE